MPDFRPTANEKFSLEFSSKKVDLLVMEHPNAPQMAHSMEGAKALVYRVQDMTQGNYYAFKIMKNKYREPSLIQICDQLDKLKSISGLAVCDRRCLSRQQAFTVIQNYPNLEYSILMPWVEGYSWFDVISSQGSIHLDQNSSLRLALNFAALLSDLESKTIAHCDLSAGNIIVDFKTLSIELIDVEDIYVPGFQTPAAIPCGTSGYKHVNHTGYWGPLADRFAGAIILSEMLAWFDSSVYSYAGESYFEQDEIQTQKGQHKFNKLNQALNQHNSKIGELLKRAWASKKLDECPKFSEWFNMLKKVANPSIYDFEPFPEVKTIVKNFSPFWRPIPTITPSSRTPSFKWEK